MNVKSQGESGGARREVVMPGCAAPGCRRAVRSRYCALHWKALRGLIDKTAAQTGFAPSTIRRMIANFDDLYAS